MKINHFEVYKLHNIYDYDIQFNEDVTFLYGCNGCGKTTILKLITLIITGYIFKLLDYNFKSIILKYSDGKKIKQIIIDKLNQSSLKVIYNDKEYKIDLKLFPNAFYDNDVRASKEIFENLYFRQYPWLKDIQTSFNFIFLPLSRNNNIILDFYENRYAKRDYSSKCTNDLESSLNLIKSLISENYIQISSKINEINLEFRNKMFMSFFHFTENTKLDSIVKPDKNFEKTKSKLLKTFNDIGILNNEFSDEIESFYSSWKLALESYDKCCKDKNASFEEVSNYLSALYLIMLEYNRF